MENYPAEFIFTDYNPAVLAIPRSLFWLNKLESINVRERKILCAGE